MKSRQIPIWKKILFQEVPLIIVAHAIMLTLVISVFAASKANAFEIRDHPTVFIDFNITSSHSEEFYQEQRTVSVRRHAYQREISVTENIPYNEDNFGLGLRWEVAQYFDVSVGFYDNSFHKTTVYLGAEVHTARKHFVSVGVVLAGATGYSNTPIETPVILLPVVQIGVPQIGVRISYIPIGAAKFGTQFYLGF